MFNFNPFSKGSGPSLHVTGRQDNKSKATISDNVEDVPFEDIPDRHTSSSGIDRYRQISEEAERRYKNLPDKNPMVSIIVHLAFASGAMWADEHPDSRSKGVVGFYSDLVDYAAGECKRVFKEVSSSERQNKVSTLGFQFTLITEGGEWAYNNPISK